MVTGPLMSLWDKYGIVPGRGVCVFDPGTMIMGASMAATAVGGGLSAASTIAGGNTAKQAGLMQQQAAVLRQQGDNYQADQLVENEGSEIGAAQRQMLDTQFKTKMANSSLEARGAASGVNIGTGSPLATEKAIASRGSYQALSDLYNGQNRAVGLDNQAAGLRYSGEIEKYGGDVAAWSGEQQRTASNLAALGTIAGSAGSMLKTYGAAKYPTSSGQPGVRLS
jgi:hypothetical protein